MTENTDPAWFKNLCGKRICILTFGCTYNEGDSVKLLEILMASGCTVAESTETADAIIINTCIVIGSTERKMNRLIAAYQHRELYITGCMPLAYPDREYQSPSPVIIWPDEIHTYFHQIKTVSPIRGGIVQIGKGCVGTCSYCITKRARGSLESFEKDEILMYIRQMADANVPEVRLTSQDLSAYGIDRGEERLSDLLAEINRIPGDFMVRLGMMNPATLLLIIDSLLPHLIGGKIFSFLHIPVQSGSDRVLSSMNRGYRVSDIMTILSACRNAGDIGIATDIITGFPGEEEEDVGATVDLLETMNPAMIHITRYSLREGTSAASYKDMPDRIKKDRSRELTRVRDSLLRARNQQMIGSIIPVLVTEKVRSGSVTARTKSYQNVLIQQDLMPGTRVFVSITGERTHFLIGEVVQV